ncbi:MAG: cytochrome C oxidase Cbb3 [Gammaproteobacteria bacterium]|nr:cytochrome C oxidase Cbb3 [Gammaproteobacteria bacterium]
MLLTLRSSVAFVSSLRSRFEGSLIRPRRIVPCGGGLAAALIALWIPLAVWAEPGGRALYDEHCASCHGESRLGGTGPALLPQTLTRLDRGEAADVIRRGRPATQMPGFGERLEGDALEVLVDFIYASPARPPRWGLAAIRQSRVVHHPPDTLADRPVFEADPLNLFVVVEKGDHHATILDGDRFEPIHRFATRPDLHGGPKYSPDGRYVYFGSRGGWVSKFDLYNLETVAEARAGINTRNIAVSDDGRLVLVGNYLPRTLVLLSAADLAPVAVLPVRGREGESSRVSAVYTAAPRGSFVVALKDIKEVWEIPYRGVGDPLPVHRGPMHEYRASHASPRPTAGDWGIRRIETDDYLDDFFFGPRYRYLVGASREGGAQVLNLDAGRVVAHLDLPGFPHLGSGITWRHEGRPVLATPNLKEGALSVIDMERWKVIKRIETAGPGFFLRSHENTPYAWADVFFGPNRDAVHVIDKRSLEIVKTLRPAPGKVAAHVEFTRDGRYALLSIWDRDGALVVYDARSLEEVKRIPMSKPSGKYNVYNKIHLSPGTSH